MRAKRIVNLGVRLVAVAVLAAALSACDVVVSSMNANGKAQDEWSRSYPIASQGQVEVVNTNGLVEVLAAEGNQVEVRAERIARASTDDAAKQLLADVQIKEDVSPNAIRLETITPHGGFHTHGEVRYHLRVPASVSVRVRNTNGKVRIDGVKGDVRAETTNGGVRGRGLVGAVEAHTTNGGVELDVTSLSPKGLRAETVNGGVEVTVPENIRAELAANCVHGGINVSGLKVDGETSRNHVEGTVNGGGPRITLETTNGGIRLVGGSSAK